MASHVRTIMGKVILAFQAINGAGSYSYDFSTTGRVQIGMPTEADGHDIMMWLDIADISSEHGPELGGFKRTLTIDVMARAKTNSRSEAEQVLDASDLANEMVIAIEADRGLGGNVNDLIYRTTPLSGSALGFPDRLVVLGEIVITWWANSGVGI